MREGRLSVRCGCLIKMKTYGRKPKKCLLEVYKYEGKLQNFIFELLKVRITANLSDDDNI